MPKSLEMIYGQHAERVQEMLNAGQGLADEVAIDPHCNPATRAALERWNEAVKDAHYMGVFGPPPDVGETPGTTG